MWRGQTGIEKVLVKFEPQLRFRPVVRPEEMVTTVSIHLVGRSATGAVGPYSHHRSWSVFSAGWQVERNIASSASEMIFKERNASAPNSTGPNYVCFPGADHLGLLES